MLQCATYVSVCTAEVAVVAPLPLLADLVHVAGQAGRVPIPAYDWEIDRITYTRVCSGAEAQEDEQAPFELDKSRRLEPSEHSADVAPADRGDLGDHQ